MIVEFGCALLIIGATIASARARNPGRISFSVNGPTGQRGEMVRRSHRSPQKCETNAKKFLVREILSNGSQMPTLNFRAVLKRPNQRERRSDFALAR